MIVNGSEITQLSNSMMGGMGMQDGMNPGGMEGMDGSFPEGEGPSQGGMPGGPGGMRR